MAAAALPAQNLSGNAPPATALNATDDVSTTAFHRSVRDNVISDRGCGEKPQPCSPAGDLRHRAYGRPRKLQRRAGNVDLISAYFLGAPHCVRRLPHVASNTTGTAKRSPYSRKPDSHRSPQNEFTSPAFCQRNSWMMTSATAQIAVTTLHQSTGVFRLSCGLPTFLTSLPIQAAPGWSSSYMGAVRLEARGQAPVRYFVHLTGPCTPDGTAKHAGRPFEWRACR